MKYILIPVILTVISFCAQAQETYFLASTGRCESALSRSLPSPNAYAPADPKPRGLRQRNAGRFMTLSGIALGVGGVMVFTDARKGRVIANGQVTQEPEAGQMMVGLLMIEGGIGLIIPGVILWKRGQKKYDRWLEQQSVKLQTHPGGVTLTYSF